MKPSPITNHQPLITIFAPATAPGRAGVAVVRISGPQAKEALAALGVVPLPAPRQAALRTISAQVGAAGSADNKSAQVGAAGSADNKSAQVGAAGSADNKSAQVGAAGSAQTMIDQALVLWFPAPASFTGEDVAELHLHGSRAVLQQVLQALAALPGLRLAAPGEFTRRAYLNGKMDLTQAEGLADLIDAETELQARQAVAQLEGHAGRAFEAMRARIVKALAHLEAYIDFPDEEIPDEVFTALQADIGALTHDIRRQLADSARGKRIREGVNVVILGAPNAGKSSLLNALSRRDIAIVSDIAGTTRDSIEVHLNLGGLACTLIDTAGLRDSNDPIEREGIARAQAKAKSADLKLVLFDSAQLPQLDDASLALLDDSAVALLSKADSAPCPLPTHIGSHAALPVSTHADDGLEPLLALLSERLQALTSGAAAPLITRARHREALKSSEHHMVRFLTGGPIELMCEELRRAAADIGKITGKISVDELLDRIFHDFCIGK